MPPLRIRLNAGFSGPQAGFFLAEADGHFARASLDVELLPGNGAGAVILDMDDGHCEAAYGDLNALLLHLARLPPGSGPQAVYVAFTRTPLTIAVRAEGPVQGPRDLAGRTVSGHDRDAALLVFPAYARAAGLDPDQIRVALSKASLGEQVRAMVEDGAAEGVFGFVNTIIASLASAGHHLEGRVRFLEYADHLPDLYGNALVVSRRLITEQPAAVRALVGAVARGMQAAIADPARGVAAIKARAPGLDLAIETRRLRGTIAREMAGLTTGDADPGRLARGIALLAAAGHLPRAPAVEDVFSGAWLAPRNLS